jgi:hypothetical protein
MTVGELVPFTGYYSMNIVPGAFLSIDTTEEYAVPAGIQKTTTISINVSMDGKSVATYPFSGGATFDGRTLKIPATLSLDFTRGYNDGHLVTFSGTIGSKNVNGETSFNPVPLPAFIGDYYDLVTSKKVLSIRSETAIHFDFSTLSNPSGELQPVSHFSYVPAMFVLTFNGKPGSDPASFMLMLGTAGKLGLACSVQDGGTPQRFKPRMSVSIPPLASA